MKKAIAVLNIGGKSFCGKSRRSFEAAAKRWGCDLKEFRRPIVPGRHPYWQKTLVCRELSEYDRVLQLDADMLIRWNSPSPFDLVPEDHLGLVSADQIAFDPDKPACDQETWEQKRAHGIKLYRESVVSKWAKRLGVPEIDDKYHANAGFFMYSPKHHQWLWDELTEIGISVNNPSTLLPEQANFSMLVQRHQVPTVWLPQEWNLMVFRRGRRGHCMHGVMAGHIYHFLGGGLNRPPLARTKWYRASAADDAWMRMPKEGGHFCEVGVNWGHNAANFAFLCPTAKITMVDGWGKHLPSYTRRSDANAGHSLAEYESRYQEALWLTRNVRDRTVIRELSTDGAKQVEDESCDIVYIDADHTYGAVRDDIAAWLPKVKTGGWIGGHDYVNRRNWGVIRAVNEAFGKDIERGAATTWWHRVER